MIGLQHFPLGKPLPGSAHSVCVSLPRMDDVIDYEEKRPETHAVMKSGYPRFFMHSYLQQTGNYLKEKHGLKDRAIFPVSSETQLAHLARMAGEGSGRIEEDGIYAFHVPEASDVYDRAKAFCQHTGCLISSRQAEDFLCARGLLEKPEAEEVRTDDADGHVRRVLAGIYSVKADDVLVSPSGMSSIDAAYRGVSRIQRERCCGHKRVWIQLGWLYLDTIEILQKFQCFTFFEVTFSK